MSNKGEQFERRIEDVTDISTGVELYYFLAVLCRKLNKEFPIFDKKEEQRTNFSFIAKSNVQGVIDWLKTESIQIHGISSIDIVDKKVKIILGLIWTIILHFHVHGSDLVDGGGEKKNGVRRKPAYLESVDWINGIIAGKGTEIKKLSDWKSGKPLFNVIESVYENKNHVFFKDNREVSEAEVLIKNCINFADHYMNIPSIITKDEFIYPEKLSLTTYISYFRSYSTKVTVKETIGLVRIVFMLLVALKKRLRKIRNLRAHGLLQRQIIGSIKFGKPKEQKVVFEDNIDEEITNIQDEEQNSEIERLQEELEEVKEKYEFASCRIKALEREVQEVNTLVEVQRHEVKGKEKISHELLEAKKLEARQLSEKIVLLEQELIERERKWSLHISEMKLTYEEESKKKLEEHDAQTKQKLEELEKKYEDILSQKLEEIERQERQKEKEMENHKVEITKQELEMEKLRKEYSDCQTSKQEEIERLIKTHESHQKELEKSKDDMLRILQSKLDQHEATIHKISVEVEQWRKKCQEYEENERMQIANSKIESKLQEKHASELLELKEGLEKKWGEEKKKLMNQIEDNEARLVDMAEQMKKKEEEKHFHGIKINITSEKSTCVSPTEEEEEGLKAMIRPKWNGDVWKKINRESRSRNRVSMGSLVALIFIVEKIQDSCGF